MMTWLNDMQISHCDQHVCKWLRCDRIHKHISTCVDDRVWYIISYRPEESCGPVVHSWVHCVCSMFPYFCVYAHVVHALYLHVSVAAAYGCSSYVYIYHQHCCYSVVPTIDSQQPCQQSGGRWNRATGVQSALLFMSIAHMDTSNNAKYTTKNLAVYCNMWVKIRIRGV
jgi:hypothetical protein